MARQQRTARLHQLLLGGEQVTLCIQHFKIRRAAIVVTQSGQTRTFGLSRERSLRKSHLLGEPVACRQGIGHFPEGRLYALLVIHHGEVSAYLGEIKRRAIASGIENRQGQTGQKTPGPAARIEQAGKFAAGRAEGTGQRDARKKSGARYADIGTGNA